MAQPRFHLTEAFLAQAFAAKAGMDQREATEACAVFIAISEAMGLITAARLEAVERDAKILDLRGTVVDGKPVTCRVIALRLGMSRVAVHEAIRRHQRARREVLRRAG